ncbi:antibiotic biosynthesis monooxygenase family protein [Paractinoplanes toevensis]|uniref:ABM domain-containing protein n=1 Tax=Paractinoplanes toevensis TaxID=571911 RepID=A0A919TBK1_9ACTN|nr:antibiotic biosynthesis monooxygenase family protein [Actinoplanes toevensis]GIM92618.1 hypothetical protein Ato02nite_044110 [Actinoplanes toevensis]
MSVIPPTDRKFAIVNVFHTSPEHQDRLLELMSGGAVTMGEQPGCVSVTMEVTDDGTKLISTTVWETEADFTAMRARSDLQTYFREVSKIISKVDSMPSHVAYDHIVTQPA